MCCSVVHCVAVCHSVSQCVAVCCKCVAAIQEPAHHCHAIENVFHCVALFCGVLQCVASVLQQFREPTHRCHATALSATPRSNPISDMIWVATISRLLIIIDLFCRMYFLS